jgi:hypothetical protein
VENDLNGNNNNNNYYNQNRSNNRNNQNNNWNRCPRYRNNNFNSFAPLGNLRSNFNSNHFNNDGYRNNPNNPSRFMPRNPTPQNQGWSQMPYGNPNQGMPTYSGQVLSWVDETVICFNYNQPGHIKPNCPNARANIPYIPLCGNCKQNGHTAEECNGPKREGPRDNNNNGQGNNSRDNSAKLVQLSDDYDMKSNNNNNNNNNGNNQNVNRNVNYVGVIRDNPMPNLEILPNRVHNVIGVRTRDMLAKQIPTSSQPIVPPPVPLPIETSGSEKEPSIPPGLNLPIATIKPTEILDNSSKANPQGQPIVQSMIENSFTTGMP